MYHTPPVSQTFKKASVEVLKRSIEEITNEILPIFSKMAPKKEFSDDKSIFLPIKNWVAHPLHRSICVPKVYICNRYSNKKIYPFSWSHSFHKWRGLLGSSAPAIKEEETYFEFIFFFQNRPLSLATYCTKAQKGFLKLNNNPYRNCIYLQYWITNQLFLIPFYNKFWSREISPSLWEKSSKDIV